VLHYRMTRPPLAATTAPLPVLSDTNVPLSLDVAVVSRVQTVNLEVCECRI
jgi:hypothetical protein